MRTFGADERSQDCPSCGAKRPQRFCPACGEARVEPERETLIHFGGSLIGGLTNLDSRLWRTTIRYLFRPGELVAEHFRGVRKPYLPPVQVLLLAVLFVLLLGSGIGYRLFSTGLSTQINGSLHGDWALSVVTREAADRGLTVQEYGVLYDEQTLGISRLALLTVIPLAAFLSWLFLLPARLSAAKHFVLATYQVAWFVVIPGFLIPVGLGSLAYSRLALRIPISDDVRRELPVMLALIAGTLWWLLDVQKRTFQTGRPERWLRAVPWTLAFLFLGGSQMRLVLFVATIWRLRE